MSAAARAIPILLSMSICWRDTKGTASARRGRAPPCTRWIFPELANSRRSRRIVSSETLYRLLRSAARTRPSLPSSSRMYRWRSSFRAIWPASASGFILSILHEYTWVCTYIRVSSDLCMILQNTISNAGELGVRQSQETRKNPILGTTTSSSPHPPCGAKAGHHKAHWLAHISQNLLDTSPCNGCGTEGDAGTDAAFNNPRHPRHLHSSGHHRKAICADSCR